MCDKASTSFHSGCIETSESMFVNVRCRTGLGLVKVDSWMFCDDEWIPGVHLQCEHLSPEAMLDFADFCQTMSGGQIRNEVARQMLIQDGIR